MQINIPTCNFCFHLRRILGITISSTVILFGRCKPRFPCSQCPSLNWQSSLSKRRKAEMSGFTSSIDVPAKQSSGFETTKLKNLRLLQPTMVRNAATYPSFLNIDQLNGDTLTPCRLGSQAHAPAGPSRSGAQGWRVSARAGNWRCGPRRAKLHGMDHGAIRVWLSIIIGISLGIFRINLRILKKASLNVYWDTNVY